MKTLTRGQYQDLAHDAKILEQDTYGPKVLLTPDGRIVKLFRRKRFFSLATLYPYAMRFCGNAKRLNHYGVPSVRVGAVYQCPAIRRDVVIYPLLPGEPIRDLLENDPSTIAALRKVAEFIALLHHKGIYFRSLHLGNLLLQPDGELALIDVADLRFRLLPMGPISRARNLRHLFRYPQDMDLIKRFGIKKFLAAYLLSSGVSPWSARIFLRRLFPNLYR